MTFKYINRGILSHLSGAGRHCEMNLEGQS